MGGAAPVYDVIIVGAGPAGATLARLIADAKSVLIVEKRGDKAKCCGGLVAPDAQAVLASFDIGIPKAIVADPQLLYVRSIDLETGNERSYQRHYTNVQRRSFDEYALELLPRSVSVKKACSYVRHERRGMHIAVTVDEDGVEKEYSCGALVGADGARSRVRESLYGDFKRLRKYLAIQGEYARTGSVNHYAVFFDRAITDFYAWLIPKDTTILVGGAFKEGRHARRRYDELIAKISPGYYGLGERVSLDACYVMRPRLRDIKTGKGGVYLVGEAAGFISPSSSEGLSYAYRSAMALKDALLGDDGDAPGRYRKKVRRLRLNILAKNIKGIFLYNHTLRNIIFFSKIGSLRRNA